MEKVLEQMKLGRARSRLETSKLKQGWEIWAQKRCGERAWGVVGLVGGLWSRTGPVAVIAMDYLPLSPYLGLLWKCVSVEETDFFTPKKRFCLKIFQS